MTHRPYPNPDRARRQVQRHDEEAGPFIPAAPLPEWRLNLARQANAALTATAARTAPITAFATTLRAAGDAVRRAQDARPNDFVLS